MIVKLLTEHHLEFLSLKGGCTGSSESTLVKMPHCWKSHFDFLLGCSEVEKALYPLISTGSEPGKQEHCWHGLKVTTQTHLLTHFTTGMEAVAVKCLNSRMISSASRTVATRRLSGRCWASIDALEKRDNETLLSRHTNLTLNAPIATKVVCFLVCWNV